MIRFLAGAVLCGGAAAALAGVAYAINGATQAGGHVVVDVQLRPGAVVEVSGKTPTGAPSTVVVPQNAGGREIMLSIPGTVDGTFLEARADDLRLRSWDSTVTEQLLSRAGTMVLGVCVGVGAVWLRRVLLSIADGEPFRPGNAARIAGMGGLVVVGLAQSTLPLLASNVALHRVGLTGASSPVFVEFVFPLGSLLTASILLALAEAFRRGGDLARDTEGLV